jgi:large subunit ribosomal protein L15
MANKIGLHNLSSAPGSSRNRKRIGRGPGSGTGKTSGKGHKGSKARAGHHGPGGGKPQFEGFTSPFRVESQVVRLGDLAQFEGKEITTELLVEAGMIHGGKGPAKVLANGEITQAVTVRGLKVSSGAREKIVAAGGTVA